MLNYIGSIYSRGEAYSWPPGGRSITVIEVTDLKTGKNSPGSLTAALCAALLLISFAFPVSGCRNGSVQPGPDDTGTGAGHEAAAVSAAGAEALSLPLYSYKFDPHVLPREYVEAWGVDFERRFYGFCDAVLAGEDTFACASREEYFRMLSAASFCLPIAPAVIDRDRAEVSGGVGHIAYRMDKAQLAERVGAFKRKVSGVITSAVPYDEDDLIKAMELYTAVTRKDSYDEDTDPSRALLWQPYRAITEDIGICQEIAGEYIYYLLQTGINAIPCSGLSRDGSFAHEWALVELDGSWYHMDPTFGIEYEDSLLFFGMDDAQRERFGDLPAAGYSYGESELISAEEHRADSDRFSGLRLARSYSIDHAARTITVERFSIDGEGMIVPGETGGTEIISY